MVLLLAYGGLRIGEALPLRRKHPWTWTVAGS